MREHLAQAPLVAYNTVPTRTGSAALEHQTPGSDPPDMIALNINGNAREFDVSEFTVAQLVSRMGLEGKRIAIERNGEIVPRSTYAETPLLSGDKLEIVGAVGGG